jgi:integrase
MRARGEGTLGVERRAGRAPVYIVRHSIDGRRVARRFLFTEAGKAQAVEHLRSTSNAVGPAATSPLGVYLDAWIAGVRATIAPATWRRYEQIVRLWLKPRLGTVRLDRLTVGRVRQYLYGLPLHEQTISHHRAVLRKALADAMTDGLVTRNVAALAKPPTVLKVERRWLSGDELRTLFAATEGSDMHALWVLAGTVGLRNAELLALSWSDVDLEGGSLRIRHTLHREGGTWALRPTKTRTTRHVPLTGYAVWALRQHHARQSQAALGSGVRVQGLVFTTSRGLPWHGYKLPKALRADLRAAGLPEVTLHDLRHSCASWWLSEGVDIKTVSVLLGHSDPRITMSLYLHVSDALKADAAARLQRSLGSAGPLSGTRTDAQDGS